MTLRRLAACCLLAVVPDLARVGYASGGPPGVGLPDSATPPSRAAAAVEWLPPGVRPATERPAVLETSHGRRWVERVGDVEVEYTVDPELEDRVRGILERIGVALGHAVLMDPASGELFAYVSTDPEIFPATRAYPTASLMKVVTGAAVLRHAPQAARRDCRYTGSPYRVLKAQLLPPSLGGRFESFRRALAISNNQCFARLAVHDVGEEALFAEMRRAGLLEPPAAGHTAGRVEAIEGALDLGHLGSGLHGSFVTPLAAARLAALLARGELVRPWWIASARDAGGTIRVAPGREVPRAVWPEPVARELREMLVDVTTEGTARRAFGAGTGARGPSGVRVSGKTGTLSGSDPPGRYRWFIGVAPAEAPRVAFATLVVDGRASAAQAAAAILAELFCGPQPCRAPRLETLHARARARDTALAAEAARRRLAKMREENPPEASAVPTAHVALDRTPRPVGVSGLDLPRRLLRRKAHGEIVLLVELSPAGEVVDVRIDASDLPDFEDFVVDAVRGWRFTPPTRHGRPVQATARLPIPIHVDQRARN